MTDLPLSEWLTNKFLEWQLEEKEKKSITDFATYLGLNRSYLSKLMSGTNKSISEKTADTIAIHYPDVYEVAGLKPKDPLLAYINFIWPYLPDEAKQKFEDVAAPYSDLANHPRGKNKHEPKTAKSTS